MVKIYFQCSSGGPDDSIVTGVSLKIVEWNIVPRIGETVCFEIDSCKTFDKIRRFRVDEVIWNLHGNAIVNVSRIAKHMEY